jgi:hypothetical protein
MPGFGAVGVQPIGVGPPQTGLVPIIVVVSSASYALTANAVTLNETDNISPAAFVVAPQGVTLKELEAVAANSFAVSTVPVSFKFAENVAATSNTVTTYPTTEPEVWPIAATSFAITFNDVPLKWTGAPFDLVYGGVGHYKYEAARARQLAKITRTIPPPIDRRSAPTFAPIGQARPPIAPAAPAVDMAAIQNQRMAEQAQAAAVAAKRRRNEQALLLLAS